MTPDGASPLSLEVRDLEGRPTGTLELDPEVFGLEPNRAVMWQVVTAQLAGRRRGTHSTLTRAEARGGGAKPYRQKGTGRARQGSIRAPQFVGGGVALGPKPRNYAQRTPKKMVRLALRSALSDRAREGRVAVVESWDFPEPRTKRAVEVLGALGLEGKVLVVLDRQDWSAERSFNNLPQVRVSLPDQLTTYDVLSHDWVAFSRATLPGARTEGPRAAAEPDGPPGEQEAEVPATEGEL
jgi:large subunit ribosomal protein L4